MLRIQAEALTYDDVSLVPAHSTILPKDVTLTTRLTKGLSLRLPIVSAAMDTVTESRLAIALAQLGGIGIIHKNMSAEAQAAQVARVKNFEAGVIRDPFTVGPDATIGEVLRLTRARNISGVPVVDGGTTGRHRHRPRHALREEAGRSGPPHHDQEGSPGHGQGRRVATTK
jgi:IMP dehydrogenase